MRLVYLNGSFIDEDHAFVSIHDRGFLYGDGLFETLKAHGERIYFLGKHLERLRASCRKLSLHPSDSVRYEHIIRTLIRENNLQGDSVVRITVSRGRHSGTLSLSPAERPTILITVRPYEGLTAKEWEEGITLCVEREICQNPRGGLCMHKSLNYLPYLIARTRAIEAGHHDAILTNVDGDICECTSANIFFFRGDRLQTPALSCGILPGIMRDVLLTLGRFMGRTVEEVCISPDELLHSAEVFMTNSVLEIVPVGRIEHTVFAERERTRSLRRHFIEFRDAMHKGMP